MRQAVTRDCGPCAPLLLGEEVRPIRVYRDVLGRGAEGDEERDQAEGGQTCGGRAEGEPGNGPKERDLHGDEPPPAPAEAQGDVPVHEGGPEELDRIGDADQGKDAYSPQVDAGACHPRLEHHARKAYGQSGRKAEKRHNGHAAAGIDLYIRVQGVCEAE